MRRYHISGGPKPSSIKILDPDGKDLSTDVVAFKVEGTGRTLATVSMTVFCEYDLTAEGSQ